MSVIYGAPGALALEAQNNTRVDSAVTRTNLATNPSMEATSGTVKVRTNLVPNPLCTSGWSGRWAGGGTASTTYTYPTGTTPVATNGSYVRKTWGAGGGVTNGDTGFDNTNSLDTYSPVTAGQVVTASAYLRPSVGDKVGYIYLQFFAADKTTPVGGRVNSASTYSLPANQWTRVNVSGITVPSGAAFAFMVPDIASAGALWGAGDTLDMCAPLLEPSPLLGPFFHGSTAAAGDYSYAWSGLANASTSYQQAPGVASASYVESLAYAYQSTVAGVTDGSKSIRITPVHPSIADSFAEIGGMFSGYTFKPNTTYTIAGDRTQTGVNGGGGNLGFRVNVGSELTPNFITSPVNAAGTTRVVATFTTGTGTAMNFIRLYNGSYAGGGDVWWDRVTLEEGITDGTYYDGNTPPAEVPAAGYPIQYSYRWAGVANASVSTQTRSQVVDLPMDQWTAPKVLLTLTGLGNTGVVVRITRTINGVPITVPGALAWDLVDSGVLWDYAPPLNVQTTYTLYVDGVIADVKTITVHSDTAWIQDPRQPDRALPVLVDRKATGAVTLRDEALKDVKYSAASGAMAVMGDSLPVAFGAQRMAPTGVNGSVSSYDATTADAFRQLISEAPILLLRTVPEMVPLPAVVYLLADVSEQPRNVHIGGGVTAWSVVGDFVRPVLQQVISGFLTYDDVQAVLGVYTYDEIQALAGGTTYLDWQKNPLIVTTL